jgi:hypothetical protein
MGYNPTQPRGKDGKWIIGGASRDMLSSGQIAAMETYRGEGYAEINGGLRDGTLSGDDPTVEEIDSVINTSNPESFDCYRGGDSSFTQTLYDEAGLQAMDDPAGLIGKEFVDDGYMSTTTNEDIAYNFEKGKYSTHIEIKAENLGYADMEKIFPDDPRAEGERVLPRGTKLKITAAEFDGDTYWLEATATREIDE